MLHLHLKIAHIDVQIDCSTADCHAGIAALTHLFPHAESEKTDLSFNITTNMDNGMISLHCGNESLWESRDAGEVVAAFEWAFYNRTIAALYPEFLSLHASTFAKNGNCITCAGQSGSGKSSLCTAALLGGADYFTDEYTLLDDNGCITPFPRPLQWGDTAHPAFSRQLMDDSGLFSHGNYSFTDSHGTHVESLLWHPERIASRARENQLSLLLLPHFDAAADGTHIRDVARSQALLEIASEMHHKLPPQQRIRELNQRIPEKTRCMRVVFSNVHQAWEAIEKLL